MDRSEFIKIYWNYYLMLENDFINLTRYIEIKECNYKTCSDEIIKLIQLTCSECDLIFKKICGIDLNDRHANIAQYATILDISPDIVNEKIEVKYRNIILQPFKRWNKDSPWRLWWWNSYNKIKHNRENNYKRGKVKVLLDSLAALYFLEMFLCRKIGQETYDIDIPNTPSKLFDIIDWKINPTDKSILVEKDVPDNEKFDIQIPYIVGNFELEVYCNGERLLLATRENGLDDGHYIEIGDKGQVSHYIQAYNWGDNITFKKGDIIHVRINNKYR